MATLYISDETKSLLDKLSANDHDRPLANIISILVEEKAKQLGIMPNTPDSVDSKDNKTGTDSQD